MQLTSRKITHLVGEDVIFQMQGSSNLCGVCALNNALGKEQVFPADMDKIADQLWSNAVLSMQSLAVPVPATRFWDGN